MDSLRVIASIACPILPVVTLCYVAACAAWPFKRCRRCHGTGRRQSPTGRAFRECRPCKGTGMRVRAGRRIYEYVRAENQRGTR